jgi:hypothetical protein
MQITPKAICAVAIYKVHPSAGFASSNKILVSPRSNHREWLTQCKNSYYYERKENSKLIWLFPPEDGAKYYEDYN